MRRRPKGWRRIFFCASAWRSELRSALITFCGLVALFTPLALWVAWSQWVFWLIIACGCGALVIIYLVLEYSPDEFF